MKHHTGDEILVTIDRQGLRTDEGIAHLPDETMVVISGAGNKVGETVRVTITGHLQTSLGDLLVGSAAV